MPHKTLEQRREYHRAWRAKNPDKLAAASKRAAVKHAAYKKQWREERLDEQRAAARARYAANPGPVKARAKVWNRNNPGVVNALTVKRRAGVKQRTPRWLTDADRASIRGQYEMAALMTRLVGAPYHVDHIVPLQGRNVSGLHVPANLQVIRGSDNNRKSATWAT